MALIAEIVPSALELKVERGAAARFSFHGLQPDAPVRVYENDPFLANKLVTAALNWGDGSPVAILGNSVVSPPGIVVPVLAHDFAPGTYTLVLNAQNYRSPVPDLLQRTFALTVIGSAIAVDELGKITGPILPRDAGYPNAQQWSFNVGADLQVLESSVRMILLTAKGERVMMPEFGTNLRNVVFEPDTGVVETMVREEVSSAISTWEPRVSLVSAEVTRSPNSRQVILDVALVSNLTSQPFQISLDFSR